MFRKKNIGDLVVVWSTKNSPLFSKTSFKNLLICDSLEYPFDIKTNYPYQVVYFSAFAYCYSVENKTKQEIELSVLMNATDGFFASGKLHHVFKLKAGEMRTVTFEAVINKIGSVKVPDLTIVCVGTSSEKQMNYFVRTNGNIWCSYGNEV